MEMWQAMLWLSLAAWGQTADPYAGEYKGSEVQLKLEAAAGGYAGSIVYQGMSMALTARAAGNGLAGSFRVENQAFPFELRKDGEAVLLTTGGETYRLESVGKKAANPLARREAGGARNELAGTWRSGQGMMRFEADGTGVANGEAFRYRIAGNTLTMMGGQVNVSLQYTVNGDNLVLRGPGGESTFTRAGAQTAGAAAGGVEQELSGKYCYMANVNATNGGARSSNQCITLHGDGRYEYYGETDSYNPNGGATSQSSDRGNWTATESTITARSASGKVTTYQLQKRNHPKTNDPMIVLDGQAFVTAYQKAPWR